MPFAVDEKGLVVPRSERGTVTVQFDGSYVWSFCAPRDGAWRVRGWRVRWPEALRPRLNGTTRVGLSTGSGMGFDADVSFAGSTDPLALTDRGGHRLAVDSAGHLTRSFSETSDEVRAEIVEGTRQALADLRADGFDAHLSYGCLLGAVRDGRMIGHDTDADLAYLSRYTLPAQVISESYAMERALRRRGWSLVRMSNADLKLMHRLADGRTVHIDVFGAFEVAGTFYQLGGRSGTLPRSALTPAGTVVLEGVELPAPADPEAVLAFLYGPTWRTPDPAFANSDPPGGLRRIQGWMRGVRDDVVSWNEYLRDRRDELPRKASTFAGWVADRIGPTAPVADLGCGTGRDASWFNRKGRHVLAYDASGTAIRGTRRRLVRGGADPGQARALALNDRRSVLVAGAELARMNEPVHLYARQLVGCLNAEGRDLLWLLASMALRRGGSLFLEFSAGRGPRPEPRHLLGRVDVDVVVAEIEARGGIIDDLVVEPGLDYLDRPDPRIARLVAHWPQPSPRKAV
ncbi:MAG: class I SAM-dependent methyltransferase [Marmoricola sp.]